MHCDMLKIQDGGAIVEKVNYRNIDIVKQSNAIPASIIFRMQPGISVNLI